LSHYGKPTELSIIKELATPPTSDSFKEAYAERVTVDVKAIEEISNIHKKPLAIPITQPELSSD
jgi:hypothetical protein